MNPKLIAIVAVVIICVAAVGAYVVTNNGGGSDKYVSDDNTGRLRVFGNANNDDYLNNADVAFLEKIIAGQEKETPSPTPTATARSMKMTSRW
jgi:iron complex transport system substrate-binding protein